MESEDWFEKKFEFVLPVGAYLAMLERVRGTPARIEEMVRSFAPATLTIRVGDNWTIQEHVGHLSDLDTLHEGRLQDFRAGEETLRAADLTNRMTTEADHNKGSIEELLGRFRQERERIVEEFARMDREMVGRSAIHPRLGKPMRVIDLAQFIAEHDDHHLAAIRLLARQLATSSSSGRQGKE